jgi:O-acetyl-ADP-ribose deacetylase (regulator of RNase III)
MSVPEIVVGDITTLDVDAIVNAANERLEPGGGVCGAIHRAAGPALAQACERLGGCSVGNARITPGFALRARYVVHAVGPVYRGGRAGEAALLASAYRRSLELAREHGLRSIAFPCISTGVFGYPRRDAARVALRAVSEWLAAQERPPRVVCCCFGEEDAAIYRQEMGH